MKFKQILSDCIRIVKIASKENQLVLFLFIGAISFSIIPFISLLFSSLILDSILQKSFDIAFNYVLALTISTFVFSIVSKYCDQMIEAVAEFAEDVFESETLNKSFTLSYQEFEDPIVTEKLRYLESAKNGSGGVGYLIICIYNFLKNLFASVIAFIFILLLFFQVSSDSTNFFTSYWSSIVIILIYIIIFIVSIQIQKNATVKMNNLAKDNMRVNTLSNYLYNMYTRKESANDSRIYNLNSLFSYYLNKYLYKLLPMYSNWGVIRGKSSSVIDFINMIFSAIAYIFVAAKAIFGVISIGNVFMYVGAITQFSQYVLKTMQFYQDISFRDEYLSENEKFIREPSKYYVGTLPIEKRDDNEYEIEIKNLSFKYPGTEHLILDNINYKFKLGQRIALVGLNGAGKTTLVKLLTKLYEPTSGEILLNGININKYDFNEYIQIFSVVFQDSQLFSYPIGENIACDELIDENKIKNILSDLHIIDRIESFKDGIKTFINSDAEMGINLSGGEQQKITIARALYKDAPFIIMDEPTASLDPVSEAEIYKEFNDIVKNKTSIFISHRMSSCIFCDEILVLDQGKLIEIGSHNQLLKNCGLYYNLWNAQAKHYAKHKINIEL